jgi:hypothetical protein
MSLEITDRLTPALQTRAARLRAPQSPQGEVEAISNPAQRPPWKSK